MHVLFDNVQLVRPRHLFQDIQDETCRTPRDIYGPLDVIGYLAFAPRARFGRTY